MPRRRAAAPGFTLVELLVVIGIIAVLLAILLPVLSRAREAGNRVKCLANLRSMVQAAHAHAAEHQGYMPAAGVMTTQPDGTVIATAAGLGDPRRVRYSYFNDGDLGYRPVPLTVALGRYMNLWQSSEPIGTLAMRQTLASPSFRQPFICPSQADPLRPGGCSIYDGGGYSRNCGDEYSSYVFNHYALARYPAPNHSGWSPAGKLTQIRRPSEVFLFADGNANTAYTGYAIYDVGSNEATLWDFWRVHGGVDGWGQFDRVRHKNKMNVAFVDGHCETVNLPPKWDSGAADNTGDLDRIGLSRGIAFR